MPQRIFGTAVPYLFLPFLQVDTKVHIAQSTSRLTIPEINQCSTTRQKTKKRDPRSIDARIFMTSNLNSMSCRTDDGYLCEARRRNEMEFKKEKKKKKKKIAFISSP